MRVRLKFHLSKRKGLLSSGPLRGIPLALNVYISVVVIPFMGMESAVTFNKMAQEATDGK